MNKLLIGALAVVSALTLSSCTCPACRGAGLQNVDYTYQVGNKLYQQKSTVTCLSCGGSGWNWWPWYGFFWTVDAGLHTADMIDHLSNGPHGGPHGGFHGGPHGGHR